MGKSEKTRFGVLILCLAGVFGALGWLSWLLIHVEYLRILDEYQANLEEKASVVAQAMDARMESFLAEEQTRWAALHEAVSWNEGLKPRRDEMALSNMVLTALAQEKPPFVRGYLVVFPSGRMFSPESDPLWLAETVNKSHFGNELLASWLRESKTQNPGASGVNWGGKGCAFRAFWHGRDLMALRPVPMADGTGLEGLVFHPEQLKKFLLDVAWNMLPNGTLNRVELEHPNEKWVLRSVPFVFSPGQQLAGEDLDVSVLGWTLAGVWSVLLAAAAGLVAWVLAMARLDQRRNQFVSSVTHELRTPLTSISLHAEMLENGMVPPQKLPEYYATIRSSCKRLELMIENVLSYARLQKKGGRPMRDLVTVEELIEPIADRLEERLSLAGFDYSWKLAPSARIRLLKTDALAVEQIMDNLANNAIKYGKTDSPRIAMTVQIEGKFLMIRFRDNGPGISPKNRKMVFDLFCRTPEAENGGKPGLGIGLALSRGLARSLGGDLYLEKSRLPGAAFVLALPLGSAGALPDES